MTKKGTVVLNASLEKLTGSRVWLHRIKTPRWKSKHVTLSSDATLRHHHELHLPATSLLIVPGGARHATHEEQLRYKRPHIMVMTAVAVRDVNEYDASRYILYFSAAEREIVSEWVTTALKLSYARLDVDDRHPLARCFLNAWGHVASLKIKEIEGIVRGLNFKLSEERFRRLHEEVHKVVADKFVRPREFIQIMTRCATNDAIRYIVESTTGKKLSNVSLSKEEMAKLLGKSVEEVEASFKEFGVTSCDEGLLLFMLYHPSNSIIDPERVAEKHDMTQPLNHYLISSSHNTYLIGNQFQSKSKADMYRIVLEKGCRCVEIDIWDGDGGQPIVRHGRSMTSMETLENVLRTINEHAFSHGYVYPVIMSIENHLSKPQQLVAARMIRTILGDLLFKPGPDQRKSDILPSPASLQQRIIIKAKTGASVLRSAYGKNTSMPDVVDGVEDEDSDSAENSSQAIEENLAKTRLTPSSSNSASHAKPSEEKITSQFADLVFLSGGNRKSLTALWKTGKSGVENYLASSCVSIDENKLIDLYEKNCGPLIRAYNKHGFSRIYPKGTRVDSSNYCPLLGHFLGCQLVALNWQGDDYAMAINHARFLGNGGCGYVLSSSISQVDHPCTLSVTIIGAFLLPKMSSIIKREVIDPYCMLKVYDSYFEDDECCSFKYSTNVAKSNGFSPIWSETIKVPIRNPSLAVINFKVYDHDLTSEDDVIGHLAVPVAYLRTELRSLPLNGKDNSPLTIPGTAQQAALLCNLVWETQNN